MILVSRSTQNKIPEKKDVYRLEAGAGKRRDINNKSKKQKRCQIKRIHEKYIHTYTSIYKKPKHIHENIHKYTHR